MSTLGFIQKRYLVFPQRNPQGNETAANFHSFHIFTARPPALTTTLIDGKKSRLLFNVIAVGIICQFQSHCKKDVSAHSHFNERGGMIITTGDILFWPWYYHGSHWFIDRRDRDDGAPAYIDKWVLVLFCLRKVKRGTCNNVVSNFIDYHTRHRWWWCVWVRPTCRSLSLLDDNPESACRIETKKVLFNRLAVLGIPITAKPQRT